MDQGCETLYVSNLNDQISVADLKALLYEFFSAFGQVVAVQVVRKAPIRGTAFVSFKNVTQASIALRNSKGFSMCGKDLQVQFARKRSDEVHKMLGTYKPRYKGVARKFQQDTMNDD